MRGIRTQVRHNIGQADPTEPNGERKRSQSNKTHGKEVVYGGYLGTEFEGVDFISPTVVKIGRVNEH